MAIGRYVRAEKVFWPYDTSGIDTMGRQIKHREFIK